MLKSLKSFFNSLDNVKAVLGTKVRKTQQNVGYIVFNALDVCEMTTGV